MPEYRVLTGPTAAGKTAWLARRAESRAIQVISADSRQVYQYMDIGTGKPVPSTLRNLPHHCISLVTPSTKFSVFSWIPEAVDAMVTQAKTGAEIWICGGTGLYIRTLLHALLLAAPPRPELRQAIQSKISELGSAKVAQLLGLVLREDYNPVRVIRAAEEACLNLKRRAEVYESLALGHEPDSDSQDENTRRYQGAIEELSNWKCVGVWALDPGKIELSKLIEARVEGMFEGGLVEEVEVLARLGYADEPVVKDGIAYSEALSLSKGSMDRRSALESATTRTRQYAKRQRTYFRAQGWPLVTREELESACSP